MTATADHILTTESVATPDMSSRVDRENKVIRGVKVLGLRSRNSARTIGIDSDQPYEYDPAAVQAAIPLYEGIHVNIDHPEFRYDSRGQRHAVGTVRKVTGRFGRLVNVHWDGAGLSGDLEYLSSHPLAEMVLEAAERMPDVLALSHQAYTVPEQTQDGRVVITKIEAVEYVDLIGERPGTTRSLFESEAATMPRTTKGRKTLEMDQQTDGQKDEQHTTEMGLEDEPVATEMDATEAPAASGMSLADAFRALKQAALDDPKLESSSAIKDIEKLEAKLTGTGATAEPAEAPTAEAEDGTGEEEKEAPGAATESLDVEALRRRDNAVRMLESAGVPITTSRIDVLSRANDKTVADHLIAGWKQAPAASQKPRSAPAKPTMESAAGDAPASKQPREIDSDTFRMAVLGR